MDQIYALLVLIDSYCSATGLSEARVSTLVLGGGARAGQIRHGSDIGARRLDRAIEWFSTNWPAGVAWPEGVARPVSADETGEAA